MLLIPTFFIHELILGNWGTVRRDFAKCELQEIWIVKGKRKEEKT